jgi:hypothetical protein
MSMNPFQTYLLSKSSTAQAAHQAYVTGNIEMCEKLIEILI